MNYRKQIQHNENMTKIVILTYLFIMYCVGILADIAIAPIKDAGFFYNVKAFVLFEKMPYIMLIILSITLFGILIIHFFGHKIMMSNMTYTQIDDNESELSRITAYNTLKEMSIAAGLRYVPKFYIMETEEMNAFASGWSKSNACVAITTGLLKKLNRAETQAVIAHEVGHIIHGDSKLTMYVGILANVILTVTDIFANLFFLFTSKSSSKEATIAKVLLLILNFLLPIVTRVLYLYLSRKREFMADAAAVKLTGNESAMISALLKISGEDNNTENTTGESFRQAAYIHSRVESVFSTHPRIKDRVRALDPNYYNK